MLKSFQFSLLFDTENSAFLIHRMANSMLYEGNPEVTINVPKEVSGLSDERACAQMLNGFS